MYWAGTATSHIFLVGNYSKTVREHRRLIASQSSLLIHQRNECYENYRTTTKKQVGADNSPLLAGHSFVYELQCKTMGVIRVAEKSAIREGRGSRRRVERFGPELHAVQWCRKARQGRT
jgi:hypothetical protein